MIGLNKKEKIANLFFGSDQSISFNFKTICLFFIFCIIIGALLVVRRPEALFHPQFWAEDGSIFFFQDFYKKASLFTSYQGYFHLIPRSVAMFAGVFPVLYRPLIYNVLALVIASVCTAWFSLPQFQHIVCDVKYRMIPCVFIALMPAAGTVLLNITNIQSYLFIFCFLIALQPMPGVKNKIAFLSLYLVSVFSSGMSIILAPLWILRAICVPKDRKISIFIVTVHVFLALYLIFSMDYKTKLNLPIGNLTEELNQSVNILDFFTVALKFLISRVVMMTVLGPNVIRNFIPHTEYTLVAFGLCCLMFGAVFIWRLWKHQDALFHLLLFAYMIVIPVFMAVFFRHRNPSEDLYFTINFASRHFFPSIAFLYFLLFSMLYAIKSDKVIKYGGIAVFFLMTTAVGDNVFYVVNAYDTNWPRWALGFEQVRSSGSMFPVNVPINPPPWVIPGSGEFPPEALTLTLVDESAPSSPIVMRKRDDPRHGEKSHLDIKMMQPQYVYAAMVKYALSCGNGPNFCAQLFWSGRTKGRFENDSDTPFLEDTKGLYTTKQFMIMDKVTRLRIHVHPEARHCEFAEIKLLVSPLSVN